MYEYLNDTDFLNKIRKLKVRSVYIKLEILDFEENIIKEVQGISQQGSLSVNGSSPVRRTINLTMFADEQINDLENLNNLISLNKKIRVFTGLWNPYGQYDPIVWFPCGLFVISTANLNRQTSGMTIQITGKDKMCLLDGSVGGALTALTNFASVIVDTEDEKSEEMVVIWDIIYEALVHIGGEKPENILILDLPREARALMRYMGTEDLYVREQSPGVYEYKFASEFKKNDSKEGYTVYSYGDTCGEQMVPFVWSDKDGLTFNAGDSIVSLLQKICQSMLTNYEFFYDVYGKFIFQEKKNYLNSTSPLNEITVENYVQTYSENRAAYSLADETTLVGITKNPKYENIKNDFVVTATRKTNNGVQIDIRYRLVIDNKPPIFLANTYMYKIKNNNVVVGYYNSETDMSLADVAAIFNTKKDNVTLVGKPTQEWREELYRQILMGNSDYKAYEADMIAEWRKLFDTTKKDWENGWNPDVKNNPELLNYWIDFIDSRSEITQYSVRSIGRRVKAHKSSGAGAIYFNQPDLMYILFDPSDEQIQYYQMMGRSYLIMEAVHRDKFQLSSQPSSCQEEVRELLYQHLIYQTQMTATCIPEYHLEPNTLVRIENEATNTNGNFVISSFNLPLSYQGTMSLQTTEALSRI